MARKIFRETKMSNSNIFRVSKGKGNILHVLRRREQANEVQRLYTLPVGR